MDETWNNSRHTLIKLSSDIFTNILKIWTPFNLHNRLLSTGMCCFLALSIYEGHQELNCIRLRRSNKHPRHDDGGEIAEYFLRRLCLSVCPSLSLPFLLSFYSLVVQNANAVLLCSIRLRSSHAKTFYICRLKLYSPNRQSPVWIFSYSAKQSSSSEAEVAVVL